MKNIFELISQAFVLNEDELNFLKDLISKIKETEKDFNIVKSLIDNKLDFNSVCAYLISEHEINIENCSKDIALLSENLKFLSTSYVYNNKQEQNEMLRKQFIAMCKDIRVIIIKLCYVNYQAKLCSLPLTQENKDLLVTIRNIYAPLSERLGLNKMKSELEDLCLKYLNPEIYNELERSVLLKKEENNSQIELTKNKLEDIIKELNLKDAVIMARQKHFSSIYKKISSKAVTLAQIYDLIAMRVIVSSIEDCYAVLGKIHGIYKPMEGRFKDYISNPKPNGYQSLHTTIITENSRPMEIQIRTFDMHKNSEFGVDVAHWIYKEKRKTTELDKKLSWLREIMDNSENLNSDDFIQTLKTNLYSGRIFVQTPKGKVLEFPEGSCIIDFAYAIHSDVGNYCVGGKINGKLVPLNTKLSNNDIIEIVTSSTSKGPSRDWLKIVKTSEARDKINTFFRKELKEENIKNGKQILELAIKNKGLAVSKVLTDENIEKILYKYAFTTQDEMFAAVGYGSLNSTQVVNRLVQEYEKQQNMLLKAEKTISTLFIKKNKDGVLIDGDSGMLIRYAKCCSPVVGEKIIGYISKGRGVTIHKDDCLNIKYLEPERLIEAEWADKTSKNNIGTISILANMVDDIIPKLTLKVSSMQYNIVGIETKDIRDKVLCNIKIKLKEKGNINILINELKNNENVLEVELKWKL